MALIDDFKAKFPEFDESAVDAQWSSLDEEWSCYFNWKYGDESCKDQAILYLIAHIFAANNKEGTSKSTASKAVGSVSVSYNASGFTQSFDIWLNTTKYGQRFLMLTQRLAQGGFFV